tara:strand:+ start:256 stop:621 length:366 start_codon:yes stop_codon:yes gene_type:complete
MAGPFKMKGMSFGNSPLHENGDKLQKEGTKVTKDTRTNEQKEKDKRELTRQTNIQTKFQNTAAHTKRRHKNQIYELGYFQGDDGKIVHPFGKGKKMDQTKWDEWKSNPNNQPYKGKTKGLI